VEVTAPDVLDLGMTWVDWNPAPPDKDMGLWRPVYLTASGPVTVRYPQVISTVDTASLESAELTVTVRLTNQTDRALKGTVRGTIGEIRFARTIDITPREQTIVRFTPTEYPQLRIRNPRLWWPVGLGAQ